MKTLSKLGIVKQLNNLLLKNKNRILTIDIKWPEYQPCTMNSNGSSIYKAITNETITITLSPKKGFRHE
jgi:hypothetical protein